VILAHEGGLDELLYFLAPIVLYLLFSEIRRRRRGRGGEEPPDTLP
jgi:hypothetical protein